VRELIRALQVAALVGLGIQVVEAYRAKREYGLVSCRPDAGVCLVFNAQSGDLEFVPLPKLPAMPGTEANS
jgi:hypothetical protein